MEDKYERYYNKNKEAIAEKSKVYRENNKEAITERKHEYYMKTMDKQNIFKPYIFKHVQHHDFRYGCITIIK
jgi:hypothetical protein